MKVKNWTEVNAAVPGGGMRLPAGGYVIKIQSVNDNANQEYLEITYDIAEGEYAGHYADAESWKHTFRRWYGEKSKSFFKQFLQALEESNANFDIAIWQKTANPFELEGLILGSIWQNEKYTNNKGEDKERLIFYAAIPADKVRAGAFDVPQDRDSRTKVETSTGGGAYDAEIPFN